ncbi:MAG: DUF4249 domain-containing protein [Saprospiraceae bacterium]|nr:DUF4249 domain-containing protein [Saprospiraceae bacterium]
MRVRLTILFFSLFSFSCEKELPWDIDAQDNDLLIVEALITNEKTTHLVKLSHTNPESNGGFNPASGATVVISDGVTNELLLEFPAGSGLYFTSSDFRALFGRPYFLFIQYNGKNYSAADASVPGQPFNNEAVYKESDNGLYTLNFSGGEDPSMTRYFMNWTQSPNCETSNDGCLAKVIYYDLKTVDVNQNFRPEKEIVYFPKETIILRKKYSLSEPYRQFLRSMLSETEWRGGYFDIQRGNVLTNMSEGAVGFFAVSTVVTDSTIVQ